MALGAGNSVSATGGAGTSAGVKQYEGRITIYVVFASILAASSALMAGYDNAITGEYCFLVSSAVCSRGNS
jgi:hypothetical protein